MKPRIVNLEALCKSLKPFLPQYLQEHGIDTNRNFKCLSPKHDDQNASMSCKQVPENAYCYGCIEEHELIWTKNGLKEIGNITTKDEVIDKFGEFKQVIYTQKQNKEVGELNLNLFRNDPLLLTKDHTCIVVEKENAINNLPFLVKSSRSNYDVYFDKRLKNRKRISKYKDKIKLIEKDAEEIKEGDYILFPIIKERNNLSLENNIIIENKKGPSRTHINKLPVTERAAYLYGLYLAEGSKGIRQVRFTLNISENQIASDLVDILNKEFRLTSSIYKYDLKNTQEVVCCNSDLSDQLSYWFGKGAKNKKIPVEALSWPQKIQQALISGWLDGDGTKNNSTKVGTTISQQLAYSLFALGIQSGLQPSLTKRYPNCNDGIIRQDFWNISFRKESIFGFSEQINNQNYIWFRARSFNKLQEIKTVIDITVKDTNSFTTKLGTVHNCGFTTDIFTAASILEKKPEKGKEWMEQNVLYLANKYHIPIPNIELTPEEIYEYKTYEAYKLAAELVADPTFGDYTLADKEIERRQWDKNKVASWGIGTVNYSEFRTRLKAAGYEAKFLDGIDLGRAHLFDNNNLIFTVYDDEGRPVGFSARALDDRSPKYINTATTGLECAIFKKGERLYGFDVAKNAADPLFIFEGQANVITLRHHGLLNCCCTMGTAFTDHHLVLLKKHGKFNIVFMFDGDSSGQESLERILDTKFANEKDFRIKICTLPKDTDPDELVREHGFSAFAQLKKKTAFEWRMEKLLESMGEDPDDDQRLSIADKMIPLIVSEPNHIYQEKMAKQVARMTGNELSTILSEVRRLRDEKVNEVQSKKQAVIEALLYDVKRNPQDAELALAECQKSISDISRNTNEQQETSSTLNYVVSMKEIDENKSGEFEGFYLRPETLGALQYRFNGTWKRGKLFFIGGSEQSGKSTLAAQLAYEIASDKRNNAMCIYHSIDDAKDTIIKKWVCNATNGLDLFQNAVANPNYWEKEIPGIKEYREKGYSNLIKLINDHRLIVKDVSDGGSLSYILSVVRYYKEIYPDRNIILLIDNFHKLPDRSEMSGQERTRKLCNDIKAYAIKEDITILSTAEYRKLLPGEKPSNAALSNSASLQYDADVIIHLYNDMHINGETSLCVHFDNDGKTLPRIWGNIGKNKITGEETVEYFNLFPGPSRFVMIEKETAIREYNERKEQLTQGNGQILFNGV